MPIRFRCVYCGQLLSIATRKAGSQVDCPKCSHPNNVPRLEEIKEESPADKESAKVAKAFESKKFDKWLGREGETKGVADSDPSDSGEVQAINEDFETIGTTSSESASAVEEPWKRDVESLPDTRAGEASDSSISTVTAILLAVAAVVLILLAFSLGILVDRYALSQGKSALPAKVEENLNAVADRGANADVLPTGPAIPLSGTIQYAAPVEGSATPDAGATVIVLPTDVTVPDDRKIAAEGIRPADTLGGESVERLKSYGGQIAKVEENGAFHVNLSEPGTYWVLVLSRNAHRDPNAKLFKSEEDTLSQYFQNLDALLMDSAFVLVNRVVKRGQPVNTVDYQFRGKPTSL